MSTCSSRRVSHSQTQTDWASKLTTDYYPDDQQTKFMHLQAEVESLLEQLQNLKSQRLDGTHQAE
ncbi:hypothetical protein [Cylindrospermum sp. FACHB-282]|uniref:hypothetical protein n=1 Tax=Cylindrospermum sp. FACHB-282 TaxID=2692794 RepID=UPI001684870C|nr:hypothetical protein [Cylindrospermum sp. FACHB-282]MBD2387020.1 hypothetical protein [Cylindrospermum sp. FACHB-282]